MNISDHKSALRIFNITNYNCFLNWEGDTPVILLKTRLK